MINQLLPINNIKEISKLNIKVVFHVLQAFILFWCSLTILSFFIPIKSSPFFSFCIVLFCSTISLLFISYKQNRYLGKGIITTSLIIFFLKLIIGLIHWFYFIDSDYWIDPFRIDFHWDYLWLHEGTEYLTSMREKYGYASPTALTKYIAYYISAKSTFIFYILSDLYYFAGKFALNISIVNNLFSLFTAFIIGNVTSILLNDKRSGRLAFFITAIQGFSIIPSIMMRDIIGQTLIAIGVLLMYVNRKNTIQLIILTPLIVFLFFSQRSLYAIIPLMVIGINFLRKEGKYKILLRTALVISGVILIPIVLSLFSFFETFDTYTEGGSTYSFISNPVFLLSFPLQVTKGILSPFPWYQFFDHIDSKLGLVYQPMFYWQSVINTTIIILMMRALINNKFVLNEMTISGLILLFIGSMSGFLNSTYISVGFIFFIPNLSIYSIRTWGRTLTLVLISFLLVNLIYYIFDLKGLTSFFRFN